MNTAKWIVLGMGISGFLTALGWELAAQYVARRNRVH